MDEELRERAMRKMAYAQELPRENALKVHSKIINLFLQISKKTADDLQNLATTYYRMAIIYFNKYDYKQAAEHYNQCITQLLQCELNDEIYRKLTCRYIDLADAFYELANQGAGNKAIEFAIKAFGLIKLKNDQEKAIGDPVANFKQFHAYYEKQLSVGAYLQSTKFENHQALMNEVQQDKGLFAQFDSISISEKNQMEHSIEQMLEQLSVSDKKEQPLFSPISVNYAPNGEHYRQSAMQILRLAKDHINKGLIPKAIETYRQAINFLQSIKEPNASDLGIIDNLQQQICFLQQKSKSAAAGLQQHGIFAAAAAAAPAPAPSQMMEEDQEDVQMAYGD